MKAQLLELNSQVNGNIGNIFGKIQHRGSKIEDPADTSKDKRIGHLLRSLCRDSHDPQGNVSLSYGMCQCGDVFNQQSANRLADDRRIVVKDGGNPEALLFKAPVSKQSRPEAAVADQGDIPDPVGAENLPNLDNQILNFVKASYLLKRYWKHTILNTIFLLFLLNMLV